MSIIRNDAGEVRLGWRLALVLLLFVAAAVILRLIPIRIMAAFLAGDGMAQADAIETASAAVLEDPVGSTAIGVLNGLMGFLIVWFMVRVVERSGFTWEALGLDWRRSSPAAILLGAVSALGLYFAVVLAGRVLGGSDSPTGGSLPGVSVPIFLQRLVLFLAMGFGEEVVFRGYLQTRLVKRYKAVWGILAAAVIFTLLHQISYSLSPIVILSGVMLWTVFGILFHLSKSLFLVGVFHGGMNTLLNTLPFEAGDLGGLAVHALALCLVVGVALVKYRGNGLRSKPI